MKKYVVVAVFAVVSLVLVSWGDKGHEATALIAENHLTPKTKAAVKYLLGNESLAAISTYADDIKGESDMRYTAPWHFADLPSGYTFEEFAQALKATANEKGNVYVAILSCERDLENPQKSRTEKAFALKLLVHFVGDCHQPMHIAHADDRGGNSIMVKFMGQSQNLHGLWDYGLIDKEGLSYKDMAKQYDTATPVQIKQWQADPVIKWLYESYLIANELYKETAESPDFGQDYYDTHIDVLRQRVLKGGIRLAGVLNNIYDPGASN